MDYAFTVAIWAIGWAIAVWIWGRILRKIGYSWWYALLLIVPLVNVICVIIVALKEWPIERECARLRLMAGESTEVDADVESVVSHAIAHEQKGQWDRAVSLYNLAADKCQNPQVKQYIAECIERLGGVRQRDWGLGIGDWQTHIAP
jgi:hypothetical protein